MPASFRRLRPGGLPLALLLAAAVAGALAFGAAELEAQEVRVNLAAGFGGMGPAELERGSSRGFGIRVLPWRGMGGGIEFDRFEFRRGVLAPVCGGDGSECADERVTLESTMELTTFLALFELLRGDHLRFRVGGGRVAGVISGTADDAGSGRPVRPPPADEGSGRIAWTRGADGSVVVFEVLYRLPVPGPVPLSALVSYRHHTLDMDGCVSGSYSPYCGPMSMNELQVGLHLLGLPR